MTIDYSSPFRVRIITDCRRVKDLLDGLYGTCLGMYEYPFTDKKIPEGTDPKTRTSDNWFKYNPLIEADNGRYIWGRECWWEPSEEAEGVPLEEAQARVAGYAFNFLTR